jgi:hypothetical protein
MRLEYSILWFDDSPDFFDAFDSDYLSSKIKEWGFSPRIVQVTTPDQFKSHEPYDSFDLLVVDYNLEDYGHGQDFIASLREHQVFTEVIFYSAGAVDELWAAIHEKRLEGVYVASKPQIEAKIQSVGHQSIRKVLDVENMRGIVMAEVGELDALLESIFLRAMEGFSEGIQKDIFKKFLIGANDEMGTRLAALKAFEESPSLSALMGLCDSNKRCANYNRARKHHETLKQADLGNYALEILWPRNCLAHGKGERQQSGDYVFKFGGKEYLFNDDIARVLRTKILAYKDTLATIATDLGLSN